ncbi:unnamed protein product [Blepharisma stoltei]|uniref:EF-hand domain-containing protein n=1 Tax=Blepharisma stoltei TaxID=1481888 RepID=A0AAU9JYP3_9CILI|nr:unnamed protein product [Blepharisma stoltei]
MQDPNISVAYVIEKFKKKGFNCLNLEEIAITQITPNWPQEFYSSTGEDWNSYQDKASERLKRANFNLKWLSTPSNPAQSPLFSAISRGDLKKVEEFLSSNDLKSCIDAVDETKKSCLHIAAKEGQSKIVEFLSQQGFSIEARDKLLTTPLHQASNSGHSNIVSYLLLKGADPHAVDISGRTVLLYGSLSPNSNVIDVLLSHDSTLIDDKDFSGRSALHYAVFNPHPKQVDIMRKLLEFGLPVDVQDNDKRTPLHHACEAGKPRAIRLLLKWGANIEIRDLISNKTPLDLSANQNIRQLVLLYSQDNKQADRPVKTQKITEDKLPNIKKSPIDTIQNSIYKEKLLSLLKRVQEAGVNTNQHYIKPYLYSGMWLEKIQSVGNLHKELSTLNPSEAVLQVFNVLFPYPKPLPIPPIDDNEMQGFFGKYEPTRKYDAVFQGSSDDSRILKLQQQLQNSDSKIFDLQQLIYSLEKRIKELQIDSENKSTEINNSAKIIKELRDKLINVTKESSSKEDYEQIKLEKAEALKTIEKLKKELASRSISQDGPKENESNAETNVELQETIEKLKKENRALRFRAGQILLKGLEIKEAQTPNTAEVQLKDDETLQRLEEALVDNPPNFRKRLTEADSNKDGKITKAELTRVLAKLILVPQDIIVMLRISGFRQGVTAVPIDDIAELLEKRLENRNKLEMDLFTRLAEHFQSSNLSVDQAFDFIDVNKDGYVNFQELSDALDAINLPLNREDRHALFTVFDSDHNGYISLDELKIRLNNIPISLEKPSKVNTSNSFTQKGDEEENPKIMQREIITKNPIPKQIKPSKEVEDIEIGPFETGPKTKNQILKTLNKKPIEKVDDLSPIPRPSQKPPNNNFEVKEETYDPNKDNLKNSSKRKVLARRGLKQNGKYYFICAYETKTGIEVELHLVDNKNSPMYLVKDKALVDRTDDINTILSKISITPDNKITFATYQNKDDDLKKTSKREVLARRGFKQNGKYYFVCAYDAKAGIEIELHLVDSKDKPMYLVQDKALVDRSTDINKILSKISITPNNKITFGA